MDNIKEELKKDFENAYSIIEREKIHKYINDYKIIT